MILITSGMFKAFWCWIYAIVILKQGDIDSSSAFCQVSGFFLALGTEASGLQETSRRDSGTANIHRPCSPDDRRS
jgi:G protein-coupled receptor GPR1